MFWFTVLGLVAVLLYLLVSLIVGVVFLESGGGVGGPVHPVTAIIVGGILAPCIGLMLSFVGYAFLRFCGHLGKFIWGLVAG